ncbi:hypothetical protein A3C34_03040 [Candidatus Amesbacteria bacterium RIFCSPHIGHO2_02_FULL_48_21]|uniref:Uncharacterized protein n=4 Tax=Candidatus Amesiibacteriota TaxID=1752730 RepID=A0A1F4Z6M1_9BACT|nr:MAG: hypothetical protein UX78_C0017G0004 [Candidatus Amesbacteria bacterium GW2011_GWA2_47_11]OGC91076.1 MAG: hypothetical protein A2V48_05045 [Candidatus Amesbacteria bacterium RBG_19FT_COMBO_48_16]OGC97564.1 MAG: hypothetical protein A3C34_03040 [Candidatus Amesbacteria bacterium RIFCSPHIGHO2_02_FULL_48_21]OGC98687.1 MAG: hypothetical protein A2W16_01275 [Candidatus Amesbacteria bacterium RBG_16_48_31]OGD00257.1 MAG: hypothetical protein A2702_03860 [Candidatus Amesbacteria bacterium RIFC
MPATEYFSHKFKEFGTELAHAHNLYYLIPSALLGVYKSQYLTNPHELVEGWGVTMKVSDKPLWKVNASEWNNLVDISEYLDSMQTFFGIVGNVPGLKEFLRDNSTRLELGEMQPGKRYSQLLTRGDIVVDRNSGQMKLVDANVVPLGLADMLALKRQGYEGVCEGELVASQFKNWLDFNYPEWKTGAIGIVSVKGAGPNLAHQFVSRVLSEYDIKSCVVDPVALEYGAGGVKVKEAGKISVLWNYVRGLFGIVPRVKDAWIGGEIGLINPPGLRLCETQAWYALLDLPKLQGVFAGAGVDIERLKAVVPETKLVKMERGDLWLCDDWDKNGPVFKKVDKSDLLEFGPQEPHGVFIKSFDTSGSKGVEYTRMKQLEETIYDVGKGKAVVAQREIPVTAGCKLELYAMLNPVSQKSQVVALGAMQKTPADHKIHGGTDTIQSLVGKE